MKRAATTITAVLGGIAIFFLTAALISPGPVVAYPDNPPTAKTGAPTQNTCHQCHGDYTENDGLGAIGTSLPSEYTPGATYTVAISVGRLGSVRWGFEATALTAGGTAAGTIIDTSPTTGLQTSGGKQYIGHTTGEGADGTFAAQADAAGWSFNWTAPPVGAGTVTFYYAGVAANNDDGSGLDYVYSGSKALTEGAPTDVKDTTWGEIKRIYR